MKKNEICLLGSSGDFYTKAVIKEFKERGLKFDLIIVKNNSNTSKYSKWIQRIISILNDLYSGKYTALSKWSFFTYQEYIRQFLFYRTLTYKKLTESYIDLDTDKYSSLFVSSINHVKVRSFILQNEYKIGVFAGVGIVHKDIIESFSECCLNAHPAPLPECRGAGALQQTLYKKLKPSASVHYATPDVDAGGILDLEPLELRQDDTLETISFKLTLLCAVRLAYVSERMVSGGYFEVAVNHGEIHFWRDCTKEIQRSARKNLKELLSKLNGA
jgi:hypothetical protein